MRTSRSQYQLLVHFMETNADIIKYENDLSSKKWGELTRKLNVDTTGEQKTVVGWKKVWKDLKIQAKRKSSRVNYEGTIDGSQSRSPLSELERRVMIVLQPPGSAEMVAATKIKLEVPEVQTSSAAEELISSNCSRFPLSVQPYGSSIQHTHNSDVQSRLQNSPVPQELMKIEFPISPIASEMQIAPVQPKNIRDTNHSCPTRNTASRRRRWCPYKRQSPPPLLSAPVWYEDRRYNLAEEYLRLWSWQLRQNERFLEIYTNNY